MNVNLNLHGDMIFLMLVQLIKY